MTASYNETIRQALNAAELRHSQGLPVPAADKGVHVEGVDDAGHFSGRDGGNRFSAEFPRYIISRAWHAGVDFAFGPLCVEDLADGFGKGLGTMGGDWSGIRDSSDEGIRLMLERALNCMTFNPQAGG